MNASTAKIIGIVLVVILGVGFMRACVLAPLGMSACSYHGDRHDWFDKGDWWFWPVAGFGGFFALLYLAVAVWILVWVYKDAQSRGMNAVLWAALVFFLHFVGLVVYLLVRSGYPVQKPGAPPAPPAAPAPLPGPTAPPVSPGAAPPAAPAAPAAPVFPACSKCGRPVHAGWVACPHCGERL